MPDAKFKCSTFSIFRDITSKASRSMRTYHPIRSPRGHGFSIKKLSMSEIVLFHPKLIPPSSSISQCSKQKKCFSFKKFFRHLYEKGRGSNPMVLQFCQNMSEGKTQFRITAVKLVVQV